MKADKDATSGTVGPVVRLIPACRVCGSAPKIARTRVLCNGLVKYGEWYATCPDQKCWAWTHIWAKSLAQAVKRWTKVHGPNSGITQSQEPT